MPRSQALTPTLAAGATACVTLGALNAFSTAKGAGRSAPARSHLRSSVLTPGDASAAAEETHGRGGLALGAVLATAALGAVSLRRRAAGAGKLKLSARAGGGTARGTRVPRAAGAIGGKKRILIMGGTRFIGCYLVAKLRSLGHEVVVLNRGKTNGGMPEKLPEASEAEYQQMLQGVTVLASDRKDPAALKAAVAGAGKFDIVFDNNVRKLAEVQPLVEAIQSTGGCEQFFLMSSAGVYGPTEVLPLNEATPGDPNSRHKEKLSCENYLNAQGLNWTSIRPVYIYGPLNYNPVERYFFDRVSRGRPVCVPYNGKYITQLGHCEDLAEFMVQCIGNPAVRGQVYNISGEEFVTFDGMAQLCAQAAGAPKPEIVHYDPKDVSVPDGFPKAFPFRGMHFFAGIHKAKTDVPGWRPKYSLLDGLKSSFLQDYKARGFDSKEVDFRTDDLILKAAGKAAPASAASVGVGDKVTWNGKSGTVRFAGAVKFAAGEWLGLELDEASGMHDGTVFGVAYFECGPKRGVFCQAAQLQGS